MTANEAEFYFLLYVILLFCIFCYSQSDDVNDKKVAKVLLRDTSFHE